MANNIDKKEPVANCDQSKIDVTKCDNHELAGNIEPLIKVIRGQQVMLDKDDNRSNILRSFQKKGLCNSGLKAKSTTFECC